MLTHDEVDETVDPLSETNGQDEAREVFQLAEVLDRAYEIRRARGGFFGYNLEDWLQAERDVARRTHRTRSQSGNLSQPNSFPEDHGRKH
jgi:hypothetical protein